MNFIVRAKGRIERELRPYWHSLGQRWCPVCDHAVREFLPLSDTYLSANGFDLDPRRFETLNFDAYRCPLCDSSDRDRLYALYLEKFLAPKGQSGRIIEFAPIGALSAKVRRSLPSWEHRTADLLMSNVDDRIDLCNMRNVYADASVDFFICSHVLEHVTDDRAAIRELYRILKPGGSGILMVPIHHDLERSREANGAPLSGSERWQQFGQSDHERLHCREDFISRVSNTGFRIEQFVPKQLVGADAPKKYGIAPSSILYVVIRTT